MAPMTNTPGAARMGEETAHKVAWAAVKKKYRKDEASGKWREV